MREKKALSPDNSAMGSFRQVETTTDSDVIGKILAGEAEFFEVLIRKNNPFLYKTGRSYGFNHHDTEDLMQEAFIAAYVNLGKFQQRSSFTTWVIQIMLNLCYKKTHKSSFKNEKPTSSTFKETITPMFSTDQQRDSHQAIFSRELVHIIETALNYIPLDYKMVFSLRELIGLSTAETAEALNITETNVKVRLNRAKHMLRERISKRYTPTDIFEFNLVYCDKITANVMQKITTAGFQNHL
ncbi:MAG: sigma-70 family RNA polymerase sigma factor [Chitinophagales bacterium]